MIRRIALLTALETKLFVREPVAVFFSLVFPLLLLAFVGSIYGSEELDPGIRFIDSYFPTMVGVTAANLGVMGLAIHLAENRSRGVLRRYRLSPLGDIEFFAAQMLTSVVMLLISLSGLSALTFTVYGPASTVQPAQFLLASFVTMYVMFSVGVFVGGLRLPVRSIQVFGTVLFFFMFFSSGAAIPREEFPAWLRNISTANPLSHLNDYLAWSYTGHGTVPGIALTAILAGAVILNLISRRTFDWEGRL